MELWTSATPNGWKVSIMLEELIEAGAELGETTIKYINLTEGEQHSPEFLAHNPNAKIPVLIDGNRSIMESCAILQYLGEKFPQLSAARRRFPLGYSTLAVLAGGQRRSSLWQQTKLHPLYGLCIRRGESSSIGAFWQRGVAARWGIGRSAKHAHVGSRKHIHCRRYCFVSVGSWMEVEQSRYHKNARCHGMDNTSQTATRRRPWHCSWRTCGRNRSLESRAQGAIPSQRVTDHQSWVVSFRMKKNPVLAARRTRPMLLDSLDHPSSCPILPFLFR